MVPLQKLLFAVQIKCGNKFRCSVTHGSVDNPLNQHNNSQGQLQYFPTLTKSQFYGHEIMEMTSIAIAASWFSELLGICAI